MATPRVFVSSTCYDLRYIRENLKFFIHNLGYEPILSEEGSVFYDPSLNVQDACLAEVPSCQVFVLIIGGRFGSAFKDSEKSITNHEFMEAVKNKTPIFALVEQAVYDQFLVYKSNYFNQDVDPSKVIYPSVDSTLIFDFVSQVQNQAINNALVPFGDFEEIQSYLKKQWASMFNKYLTDDNETNRVSSLLQEIKNTNEKIEFLSRQVVSTIGNPITQLRVKVYDYLVGQNIAHDLSLWDIKPTPEIFLENHSLEDVCNHNIVSDVDDDEGSYTFTHGGPPYKASDSKIQDMRKNFKRVRKHLIKIIEEEGTSLKQFISGSKE